MVTMLMTQWWSKNLPCVMIGTLGLGILEDWYMICKPFPRNELALLGLAHCLAAHNITVFYPYICNLLTPLMF